MRAVITVVGKDSVGILAKVSTACSEFNVNITEVSQTILQEMFCMIMMGDIDKLNADFNHFSDALKAIGEDMHLAVHVMHEDIFNSMHRI